MAVTDIFSKRAKRMRGEVPELYVYDELPRQLRAQVVHILRDMLGVPTVVGRTDRRWAAYEWIVNTLCREYGVFHLDQLARRQGAPDEELFNFLLSVKNVERALDAIELSTRFADRCTREFAYMHDSRFETRVDEGIAELNARFFEHGVGFQYEHGELIRVDSDLLHSEAVKPALRLLGTRTYDGPRQEFLAAHEHYRHGRHEAAISEALKAFESTMKAICDSKGWRYQPSFTAKNLVSVCLDNGLIDSFWQNHLNGLRATLESGIPTARNKLAGHGQGAKLREVPPRLVAYVLHLTASTIVFLIESAQGVGKAS